MNMTDARNISEMNAQKSTNGDAHVDTIKQHEDLYQLAYDAGLAIGKEEGYRRGYQEGFADCIKFGDPALSTVGAPKMSTGGSTGTTGSRPGRLRGLPCTNCGCPSYSDELQCPRCKSLKMTSVGKPSAADEESQPKTLANRRHQS
jgi:hypothetical protein